MKFARYLQDTQAPEWKKAYIDYRRLKKWIVAICEEAQREESDETRGKRPQLHLDHPTKDVIFLSREPSRLSPNVSANRENSKPSHTRHVSYQLPSQLVKDFLDLPDLAAEPSPRRMSWRGSGITGRPLSLQTLSTAFWVAPEQSRRSSVHSSMRNNPFIVLPLDKLLPQLSFHEAQFFAMLDAELEKIVAFYVDREEEMHTRWITLREQLDELGDHMKVVQDFHDKLPTSWCSAFLHRSRSGRALSRMTSNRPSAAPDPEAARDNMASVTSLSSEGKVKATVGKYPVQSRDPEDYVHAKKQLKKAVLEYYRGLEVLHNYRILNITGFRKALKKFEKVTKIPSQEQYMTERVDKTALASSTRVRTIMKHVQELYAAVYVRGDKKKAMYVLRTGSIAKSHHFSTCRSGIFLGLALPALVSGLYQSFQQETRDAIPGWDALLLVYGVFLLPTFFALLHGLSLLVWSRSSINYVFIFEFDTSTRLDYRQYFEIPSILLASLCIAFWLSFSWVGVVLVSPTVWPAVWLGMVFAVMFNPLPFLFKPSRYWLLKNVGKLLLSGVWHVEFTDFWMGDQFCSLTFTLSNLYFVGCVYANGFNNPNWKHCLSPTPQWPVSYVLAALPMSVRFVQTVRRFVDSGHVMHLINSGKYGMGIVSFLCFYLWRQQGGYDTRFAFYCFFNTVSCVYSLSWDFLMDWSLFQPDARYPLLRKELVYSQIPFYYFAIVSNIILKFCWILYLPQNGPTFAIRVFACGFLEIFRRWLWNFFRLENEHLGNVEQYRVTREVPLPYAFGDSYSKISEDE